MYLFYVFTLLFAMLWLFTILHIQVVGSPFSIAICCVHGTDNLQLNDAWEHDIKA